MCDMICLSNTHLLFVIDRGCMINDLLNKTLTSQLLLFFILLPDAAVWYFINNLRKRPCLVTCFWQWKYNIFDLLKQCCQLVFFSLTFEKGMLQYFDILWLAVVMLTFHLLMSFFADSGKGNATVLWCLRVLLPPGWGPGVCEGDDHQAGEPPTQPEAVCPLERRPARWGSLRHRCSPDWDEVSDSIICN